MGLDTLLSLATGASLEVRQLMAQPPSNENPKTTSFTLTNRQLKLRAIHEAKRAENRATHGSKSCIRHWKERKQLHFGHHPKGWLPWGNTDFAFTTLYYGEYGCFGNGSAIENRVNWLGYHNNVSLVEAQDFTVGGLVAGRMWLLATGVPFIAGM
ncbi:probable pectinesterase/pectinesterase inhibitor 33 [Tanacetum coccineum]